MKRLLLLLGLTLGIITSLIAETETVDGIEWNYSVSNGNATVTGGPTSGAIAIPSLLGGYPVTSIGEKAFYNCSGLTSITFPSTITTIGKGAFEECTALKSITIPEGVTTIGEDAFSRCVTVESVTLPSTIATIGNWAFYNCAQLAILSHKMPPNVSIGHSAFKRMVEGIWGYDHVELTPHTIIGAFLPSGLSKSEVRSIVIPEGTTHIPDGAFNGCHGITEVVIPEGVTSIGKYAFAFCDGIKSMTYPSSVKTLKTHAFDGVLPETLSSAVIPEGIRLEKLTSWKIPEGATSVQGWSREYPDASGFGTISTTNNKITSITLPSSLTSIGYNAFSGFTALTSITIPEGVTEIESGAFEDCNSLTSVHISNLAAWCGIKFGDVYSNPLRYAKNLYLNGKQITELVIPPNVTSIREYAFEGCTDLTSVEIPLGVTAIGKYAFGNCTGLTSVTIPDGVTSIGDGAFYNCKGLTSVTIPSGVTSIGDDAFGEYRAVTAVTIPDSVTSIGRSAFRGCIRLTSIIIPEGVMSIGDQAFAGCVGLVERVVIPSTVIEMGEGVFDRCIALNEVEFRCPPPKASRTYHDLYSIPYDIDYPISNQGIQGLYTWGNASAWRKQLVRGRWHGIHMSMKGAWILYLGGILLLLAGGVGGLLFYKKYKKRKAAQSISEYFLSL